MNSGAALPSHPADRILVRGVNWLGDAVMSTSALLRLREAHPKAFIALLSPAKLSELWKDHPAIDDVLTFSPHESASSVARRLRKDRFQIALILPNSFRSALEIWLAGVPTRIGYAGQWRRWLLTEPVAPRPGAVQMTKRSLKEIRLLNRRGAGQFPRHASSPREEPRSDSLNMDRRESHSRSECRPASRNRIHHLYQYLHLCARLGASDQPAPPQLFVNDAEVHSVKARFEIGIVGNRRLFALNPGAEYGPAKRWPAENFVSAARQIQERTGCVWLVLGGPGDLKLASQVTHQIQGTSDKDETHNRAVINLAGRTSLRELCALLKGCDLLLTNDTGPMHVAAALGTPVVALFGSTSAELTGPGLPGQREHQILHSIVPCSPCFLRECPIDFPCMRTLEVRSVVEAVINSAEMRAV